MLQLKVELVSGRFIPGKTSLLEEAWTSSGTCCSTPHTYKGAV